MNETKLPFIVEASELARHLEDPDILVVDLSERQSYLAAHIPGAVHIPYTAITVSKPPVNGLVPTAEQLSDVFSDIGLTAERHVVAVDEYGGGKAGRLIYTLHALGHQGASMLNGGMIAWNSEGHPTEEGEVKPRRSNYRAHLRPGNIADRAYILKRLHAPDFKVLDVRTPAEFSGEDARSARGGHIPEARNLEFSELIDRGNAMRLKPREEIKALLKKRDVSPEDEVVVHCQSHTRSAHTYVVLKALGYDRVRGYPGSWSDWGNDPDTPVES